MDHLSDVRTGISRNISRISGEGAEFTDARFYTDDSSETLVLYDGNLEANDTTQQSGIGVRVLWGGAWGFAATSDTDEVTQCFDKALANARTAARLMKLPLSMGKREGHNSSYSSPVQIDPFSVNLKDKLDFLGGIDRDLMEDWIIRRFVFSGMVHSNARLRIPYVSLSYQPTEPCNFSN